MQHRKAKLRQETVRKWIELDSNDVAWFLEHYPSGSLSWALQGLLHEFRMAHKTTPQDYMILGALELKKFSEEKSGDSNPT